MMGDLYPRADLFDVPDSAQRARERLPSEGRDFAPTRVGWAGIVLVTLLLAWGMWQLGRGGDGIGWLIASVVLAYFVAVMGWTAIRRERDRREDTRHET